MVVLLVLAACSSPEAEAGAVALQYASLAPDDVQGRHRLACADERAARSVEELQAEFDAAKGGPFGSLFDELVAASGKATRSIAETKLDPEERSGTVRIAASLPMEDGTTTDGSTTLRVRLEDGRWCVVPGWAEEKRQAGIAREAAELLTRARPLLDDWRLDEAEGALRVVEAKLEELPETHAQKAALQREVHGVSLLLSARKDGWVGGRWTVEETTDAMTDEKNVVVSLRSVGGLPNSQGTEEPVSLVVRCLRKDLEVYIATRSVLDSDSRTDRIAGQHRFGSDPAERLSASASRDRRAASLREPRTWIDQFLAREADGWTVELPLHDRKPASVRFDLTAASKALSAIPSDCD